MYQLGQLKHQIICGTSIGAILGSYLCQYSYGHETTAITNLETLFKNLSTDNIYKRWKPWGSLSGLFNKTSFYDSEPLRNFITKNINTHNIRASGRQLRIGTTHLQPAQAKRAGITNYVVYDENYPDLLKAIMASSAYAPLFEPVELEGNLVIDGGTQTVTPIKSAIDADATVIDVLICYPTYLVYPPSKKLNALNLCMYVIDLMLNRLTWTDIDRTEDINRLVKAGHAPRRREVKLNIVHPKVDLDVNALEFNKADAVRLYAQGWEDAKQVFE
jgi:predicted acylesterase/phospholipase RssA